ncbi:hypothetical protein FSP39_002537 [Pinctada imbricata]|uniref:carbonyl reductase (NADPH) n=1 Tax=Pinctada imbricata TaxID=66713 RepID=A0AA88YDD3_PINIB|nr:hypothetical protein FSP39_002537 [Pinctada imbricata]
MSSSFYPCLICAEEFNSVVSLHQHEVDSNHIPRSSLKTDRRKYLDALYKNEVLVEKSDRDKSVQYVTSVLNRIMKHVRAQHGGSLYGNEIIKAGSHSNRTKVRLADEFDFIVPLSIKGIWMGPPVSHVPYIFEDKLFPRQESVTGGNKGIGYAVVRGLCKSFTGDVYLTARDEKRGMDAVESLSKEGLPKNPRFHQLDITDDGSVKRLRDFLKENYGGLDVLVNNAGIAYKQSSTAPFGEQAEVTIATNYFGTLAVCNYLFDLLRPHARAAKKGDHKKKGYADSAYGMSKVGVSAITTVQAREMDKDPRDDIIINSCCPGYVDTDMTSHKGPKTIDQGADTPLFLALLPPSNPKNPKGCFLSDRKVKNWAA